MNGIRVCADAAELAREAARLIQARGLEAVAARGAFRLALSGGRTPADAYRDFAQRVNANEGPAPDSLRIFFADERALPPTDPESNFHLAQETLLRPAGIAPEHVLRMEADAPDLVAAAARYEAYLREPLDLIVLGIGEDGHTASLFPGGAALAEGARYAAAVLDAPKPPPRRITLTPRPLLEARDVLVLATGEPKAEAVWRALQQHGPVREVPARIARERIWLLDSAAASRLDSIR